MRFLQTAATLALLLFTACSGHVIVAKNTPHPTAPQPARSPLTSLGVPPGHYPPPGQCRIWFPGRPPGHQPRPVPCHSLGDIPTGTWVLHRPTKNKKVVEVTAYHETKPAVVVSVNYYDARTGILVSASGAK